MDPGFHVAGTRLGTLLTERRGGTGTGDDFERGIWISAGRLSVDFDLT